MPSWNDKRRKPKARAIEHQRNARSTLQSANELLADVRKELEAKKASGMELTDLESQVTQAAERLSKLSPDVKEQAAKVLEEATVAQRQLQQVQSALVQLAAQQKQAEEVLNEAQVSAEKLQESIRAYRREKLSTQGLENKLEETWSQMETARTVLPSQPDKALSAARSAAQQLVSLKTEVSRLPQLAQETSEVAETIERERAVLERQLQQTQRIGANTQSAQQAIEQLDQQLASARELQQSDYHQALASLQQVQAGVRTQQQQLNSAYEQRYFMTRTLPVSGASIAVLLIAAVLGGLRWRHLRLKRLVGEKLNAFRSEVTHWMERLDGLKQRHQLLPFTDKDFTEPMAGQTLALYNQVEADYNQLRALWLALMDRRTKAEGAFEVEQPLGATRLKEVEELLAGREDTTQLAPQFDRCVKLLDQLNEAHEEAIKARGLAEQQREGLRRDLESLAQAKLPPQALDAETVQRDDAFQQGVQILRADPLGARVTFESVLAGLRAIGAIAQRRLKCLAAWRAAHQNVEEAADLALKQRAAGIKLVEEIANPDPLLEDARSQLAKAWAALEHAPTRQRRSSSKKRTTMRGRPRGASSGTWPTRRSPLNSIPGCARSSPACGNVRYARKENSASWKPASIRTRGLWLRRTCRGQKSRLLPWPSCSTTRRGPPIRTRKSSAVPRNACDRRKASERRPPRFWKQ